MKKTENIKKKENFTLEELINRGYEEDPLLRYVLELLANRVYYSKNLIIANYTIVNGKLYN